MKVTMRHLWLGLPVFVILWKGFLFQLPTLDFWWHLKMGEVIASTRSIPVEDAFSFTAAGQPFILQNWLGELIYWETYRMGGFPLLVFLHALLSLVAFLPIYHLCLEATPNIRIAAVIGFAAAFSAIGNIRPHLYSFAMFGLYCWVLARFRSQRKDLLWTLPLLMALWVNLHGAFVLGLILIVIYLVTEGARHFVDSQSDALDVGQLKKLALILVLCVIATLLNPEGFGVYQYVQTVMTDAASQQFVTEWQPPRIDQLSGVLLFFGAFFLALVVFIYSKSKPDLTELALFVAFALLGLKSLRNGAWFCMVTYPIITRHLPYLDLTAAAPLLRFGPVKKLANAFTDVPAEDPKPMHQRINVVFVTVALVILITQSPWVRPRLYNKSLVDDATPLAATDFIKEHKLTGRIFHPQSFGDYLIWRLWPEQKSFFDGRVHLFGLEFVRKYRLLFYDSNWEKTFADWDIQYLLLSPVEEDSVHLTKAVRTSNHWRLLFEDKRAILFEKTQDPEASVK